MALVIFVLALLAYPLGRRLARNILGLQADVTAETPRARRAALLAAGPLVCWLAGFTAMLLVTTQDSPVSTLTIETVEPGYPAAEAGVSPGDQIVSVEGAPVADFEALRKAVSAAGGPLRVGLKRGAEPFEIVVTPRPNPEGKPAIGIRPTRVAKSPGLAQAISAAVTIPVRAWLWTVEKSIGGPPKPLVAYLVGDGQLSPLAPYAISFASQCNLFAAVMLLPLPGLDGGLLLLLALGRRPDEAWHKRARRIVLGLMVALVLLWGLKNAIAQ